MRIQERYRVLQELQSSGHRRLLTARDRWLGCVVVLKLAELPGDASRALNDEGELLTRLRHPHLVRFLDRIPELRLADGSLFSGFSMEWLDGDPLTVGVAEFSLEQKLQAFGQLVAAVGYLHRREMLHLDLKPDNVFWAEDGVKVLDLGTARSTGTGPGEAGGTLGYAAPEVLAVEAASEASDIFSLGVMLYELLADASPYGVTEPSALREAVLEGDVTPLRAVAPNVPRPLGRLVGRMLATDPVERPGTIQQLTEELAELGVTVPHPIGGAPPLVGRREEVQVLFEALRSSSADPLNLVGKRGVGRFSVAREALGELHRRRARRVIDLSGAAAPLDAARRMLQLCEKPAGVVFLGRCATSSPDLIEVADALRTAGLTALVVSDGPQVGMVNIPIRPITMRAARQLAGFLTLASHADLAAAMTRAGGVPGTFLDVVRGARVTADLSDELRRMVGRLAVFPHGTPVSLIKRLDDGAKELDALVSAGLARVARGEVSFLGGEELRSLAEGDVPIIRDWLAEETDCNPIVRGLIATRIGDQELASRALESIETTSSVHENALMELVTWLAEAGDVMAAEHLATFRIDRSDTDGALAALPTPRTEGARLIEAQALRMARRFEEAEAYIEEAVQERPDWKRMLLAKVHLLLQMKRLEEAHAVWSHARTLPATPGSQGPEVGLGLMVLRNLGWAPQLREFVEGLNTGEEELSSGVLIMVQSAWLRLGDLRRARELGEATIARAERDGEHRNACSARINQGNILSALGDGEGARRVYREALMIARALRLKGQLLKIQYCLAELELRCGRFSAADRALHGFRKLGESLADPQIATRIALLEGWFEIERGDHAAGLARLVDVDLSSATGEVRGRVHLLRARAYLETGDPMAAMKELSGVAPDGSPDFQRTTRVLRGRVYLSLARSELAAARGLVAEESTSSMERMSMGRALLVSAGEDLQPSSFSERRRDLERAARLLRGPEASLAASLRDRLLEEHGASLEQVVALCETMTDPKSFPSALARLVADALGANRVLILLRMPGLGQQISYRELTGEEATGIGREVMRKVKKPGDVWYAPNAFADPDLREASATVRTFEIKSVIAVAIPSEGRAIGALYVDDLHRANRFSERDTELLLRLAQAVGEIVGVMPAARRERTLANPEEKHGVLIADPGRAKKLAGRLEMLRGREQTNLLITGPTGAGKTWFARRVACEMLGLEGIEEVTLRRGSVQMLVATLAGVKRGEYTGAVQAEGAVERALRGRRALLLDEVQTLDEDQQQALLPLLELPIRRFSSLIDSAKVVNEPLHVILATNAPVDGSQWQEVFRSDLWYRMSRVHIDLPGLSERGSEVVYRYLSSMLSEFDAPAPERVVDIRALDLITNARWPGNLRELHGYAERLAAQFRVSGKLGIDDLNSADLLPPEVMEDRAVSGGTFDSQGEQALRQALERSNWNQTAAGRLLGMDKHRIRRLIAKFGMKEELDAHRARLRQER